MPKKKQLGFTLIELLIVIAIIAILIVFLFVSFTQVQKNARDAQRKSDLQTIAAALQRFYTDNGNYPPEDGTDTSPKGTGIGYISSGCATSSISAAHDTTAIIGTDTPGGILTLGIICTPTGAASPVTYIKEMPKDPLNQGNFIYTYETNGPSGNQNKNFVLCARMENASNASGTSPGTNCGWGGTDRGYNYFITSQD